MKRVIIVCEGQTEQRFCKIVLQPYFEGKLNIQSPIIKESNGGIVHWKSLKKQLKKHLGESEAYITSLIDYYGILPTHGFPKWGEANKIRDKAERMDFLEKEMIKCINPTNQEYFFPYLQLHEFEALLFSDIKVFEKVFKDENLLDKNYLKETAALNPEDINENKETHPSNRLDKIIKNYDKVFHGSSLAQEIGLPKIRKRCPRFNDWIKKMESL